VFKFGEYHEIVVSTVTTVENTKSLCGTVSVTVAVMATEVPAVELHVHSVTATVTTAGTVVSTQTGEHEFLTETVDGTQVLTGDGDHHTLVDTGDTSGSDGE